MKPVRVVYCVPSDVTPDPAYQAAINAAMLDLQKWFAGQLGGRTFTIFSPEVETFHLPQKAEHYAIDSWAKISDAVRGKLRSGFGDFIWVIYADVLHACDAPGRLGAGWPGLCILPRQDLDGLCGRPYFDDCGKAYESTPQQAVGGLGHELGHAFGLPHPPFCGTADESSCDWGALMYLGFHGYPACHLTDADKATLLQHPAFEIEDPIMKDEEFPGYKEIDFRDQKWKGYKVDFRMIVLNGELACEVFKDGTILDFTADELKEWLWQLTARGGKIRPRAFDKEK